MADGFDIHIDQEQAARLTAAAELLGLSPSTYALALIDMGLANDAPPLSTDPDPAIDRAILEKAERAGSFTPWSEVRDRLLARHRR